MTRNTATLTPQEREALIESLFTHKYSCVIRNGDEIRVFRGRGVKDLYRLLRDDRRFLDGAFVADKVVGKAAAALMILGGVREVSGRRAFAPPPRARELHARSAPHHQPDEDGLVSARNPLPRPAHARGVLRADRSIHE